MVQFGRFRNYGLAGGSMSVKVDTETLKTSTIPHPFCHHRESETSFGFSYYLCCLLPFFPAVTQFYPSRTISLINPSFCSSLNQQLLSQQQKSNQCIGTHSSAMAADNGHESPRIESALEKTKTKTKKHHKAWISRKSSPFTKKDINYPPPTHILFLYYISRPRSDFWVYLSFDYWLVMNIFTNKMQIVSNKFNLLNKKIKL